MISYSQPRKWPASRRLTLIPKLLSLVLAVLSLDSGIFAAPVRAESEASSEAGLEANFTPRGRRRGRGRYQQQQQVQNPALWNQQSQQSQQALWNQPPQQVQQGRNQNRQQRNTHPVIRNYGGGHKRQGQQQSGQGQNGQNQQFNQQTNQQSSLGQQRQLNP
jgi:hypothetical protein